MRTTLYDLQDRPIATIDEKGVIRLYNGHVVSELVDGVIAGWNGNGYPAQISQLIQHPNSVFHGTTRKTSPYHL